MRPRPPASASDADVGSAWSNVPRPLYALIRTLMSQSENCKTAGSTLSMVRFGDALLQVAESTRCVALTVNPSASGSA